MSVQPSVPTLITPPSSLPTLPFEIIDLISTFLDRRGAIPFGLASHSFRQLIIPFIWREVNLNLPKHYGETPSVYEAGAIPSWDDRVTAAGQRRISAINDMVKEALYWGDKRKWEAVKVLRLSAGGGGIQTMMVILDLVSPHLQTLEVDIDWLFYRPGALLDHDTLDLRLLISKITLPSLTFLRLGEDAVRYQQFIPHIFVAAPNLVSLDLFVDQTFDVQWKGDHIPPFPEFERDTQLQHLRVHLTYESSYTHYPEEEDSEANLSEIIQDLLERSPKLQSLIFEYNPTDTITYDILGIVHECPCLEDFYWASDHSPLMFWADASDSGAHGAFPALLRLAIGAERWSDVFDLIPQIETPEKLYFIPNKKADLRLPTSGDDIRPPVAQPMTPAFARTIYYACELRVIHIIQDEIKVDDLQIFERLDAIDAKGQYTGLIRSFWNGNKKYEGEKRECDLLHVRLLLDREEISDVQHEGKAPWERPENTTYYTVSEMYRTTTRMKTFERRQAATWQHFTYYEGKTVPLEIFEQMRVVEGVSEEEWDKRGVKVGDVAWKILKDWHESSPKEKRK